ncbi:YceI-like domain protein [mine drainage metagenome]|uniref:YceI-like domain protein n=1 Tax=mine drainage metagenome TaxID=410659 RepID=A0A1J5P5E1_9ZZZZ
MDMKSAAIVLFSVATVITLPGCTAISPTSPAGRAAPTQSERTELQAGYAALRAAGGKVFTLDPRKSVIRIYVFRGGRAARLGHNHVLSAPRFAGFLYLPAAGTANARFDLEFRLDQLEIDNPAYRSVLGNAFASALTAEDIDGVRKHMLGNDNLQADRFPFVRIHSMQIVGESPKFAVKVQIEMHGQKREMWIPLSVEGLPDSVAVTGALVLRQTDFGVQPYSALGGFLAVQDEVVIEFKLLGVPG